MRGPRSILTEGAIWLALAVAAFALTFQFDEPLSNYRYGGAGWPRAIIVGIALFASAQTVSRLRQTSMGRAPSAMEDPGQGLSGEIAATGILVNLKRLGTFAVPLVYLLLMPRMGYYIVTPFFISGYMTLLGERRLVHLGGTTLFIYVLTLLIFAKLLFVPVPVGTWPGFYEVNSLFLSLIK
jgi:hypothetical protein